MIEAVCRINIKPEDVEFDKAIGAIIFRNIAIQRSTVEVIGNLMGLLTKIANGKGSATESRKKEVGFKLEAGKFEVAVYDDYIQINYDFSDSSADLINSAKEIVCDVLEFHFAGLIKSINQLSSEDQPALESYMASGFKNATDAYEAVKKLHEISILQQLQGFAIQIEGRNSSHHVEFISPPEKPVSTPEPIEIQLNAYEIAVAHKDHLYVEIAPAQGKGKKKIFLTAEQYSELHDSRGYSIESYVLYDLTVRQLNEGEYELISVAINSRCQMDSSSQEEIDI